MSNTVQRVMISPLSILALILIRVIFETTRVYTESKGGFLFSRFWLYSNIIWFDIFFANLVSKKIYPFSVSIPLALFSTLGLFLDKFFLMMDYTYGIPINNLAKTITSFFVFSRGIPKISFILFFLSKIILTLIYGRYNIIKSIIYVLCSYLMWIIFSTETIYGKSNIFFMILQEDVAYGISGMIYAFAFFLLFQRNLLKKILKYGLQDLSILYAVILAIFGTFSVGKLDYPYFFLTFLSVMAFFIIQYIFLLLNEEHLPDSLEKLSFLIFLEITIFSNLRGIFVVPTIFIVFLSALYHLPPLEIKRRIFAPLFSSAFAGFLIIVSHTSTKKTFSIPSEVIFVSLISSGFAFLDSLTSKLRGIFQKISAFITCIFPSIFMRSPENFLVSLFLGMLSIKFSEKKIIRFLVAAYFVSQYSYAKYRLQIFL
ncbi:hypothetical protein HRbin19_00710 [bacterium HR19]|nr:hypothetical protein HRbin19_00710 [bacterium HR19]